MSNQKGMTTKVHLLQYNMPPHLVKQDVWLVMGSGNLKWSSELLCDGLLLCIVYMVKENTFQLIMKVFAIRNILIYCNLAMFNHFFLKFLL